MTTLTAPAVLAAGGDLRQKAAAESLAADFCVALTGFDRLRDPPCGVRIAVRREEDTVVIDVEDTGLGIPEEAREHIFDRFYRVDKARSRKAGGAGLGLSIVHDMTARNEGTVEVAAREGGGSRFTVRFPAFDLQEGGDEV